MAECVRDGVRLAYETAGRGEPPIVFVHGWSGDRSYFAPQIAHFSPGHLTLSLDLRGHGASDCPPPDDGVYDIETFATDVLAVAAEAGLDRPIVVGHSMGGAVALACAARSGAVRAAVMVDPAPLLDEGIKAYIAGAAADIASDHDGTFRRRFTEGMFLPSDTARRAEIVAITAAQRADVAAAAMTSIARFDGGAALGAVDTAGVPLLTIGSAVPSNAPDALRSACPSITIGQTVGAGHFNQLEVPEQVNAMIERFLAVNLTVS